MPCLNLVLQQCRNEEQKRDLLVIFTFEETDFKSKTHPCFVYTVTFGQYIRIYHLYLEITAINPQTSHN